MGGRGARVTRYATCTFDGMTHLKRKFMPNESGQQDASACCRSCGTGVDGDPEIRVSTKSWLEKRILMPLLPGIKPATFQWHESTSLQLNYIPTPRVEPGLNLRFVLYETLGDKCQVRTPWPPHLLVKWVNLCLWPKFDGQIAIGQSAYINCWVTTVL